jgi:hypothetical protein
MAECCRLYRYQFSQFHAVYDVMRAGCRHDAPPNSMDVSERGMDAYQKAFEARCVAQEVM